MLVPEISPRKWKFALAIREYATQIRALIHLSNVKETGKYILQAYFSQKTLYHCKLQLN